jgi:ABC-2 type transport system permease protein
VLFPFPGAVVKVPGAKLEFTTLLRTGDQTGFVRFQDLMRMSPFGGPMGLNPDPDRNETGESYVLAARIKGDLPASRPMADEKAPADSAPPMGADLDFLKDAVKGLAAKVPAKPDVPAKPGKVDVVVVCDIDFLHEEFFRLRDRPEFPEMGIRLEFDNVTFVLNILDELAGDERFIELRKRRREHRTLERIDALNMERRKEADKTEQEIRKKAVEAKKKDREDFEKKLQELKTELAKGASATAAIQQVSMFETQQQRRLDAAVEELTRERDRQIGLIQGGLESAKRSIEFWYKLWAVLLPPIPPLLVAGAFFCMRRVRERQGVARTRLRS